MTTSTSALPYSLEQWGRDYFSVDAQGRLQISVPSDQVPPVAISDIAGQLEESGLRLPVLLRFKSILHDRVNRLVNSFNAAIRTYQYEGAYQVVYPIKVNQQRRVVEEIVQAEPAAGRGQVGLEAGSKPELLAVLALAPGDGATIVCNGYKDQEYIQLALLGQRLGYQVHIVIEKASELPLILSEAKALGVEPSIGVRAKLNSIGAGNWQNTGGEKSKFGLNASQILQMIELLTEQQSLHTLKLLHFHLGSQIANIRDIQNGLQECSRIYGQLRELGAPIQIVDIGGGLGIDYDGTQSRNACSSNYGFDDYAINVVRIFQEHCQQHDLPHPDLISESGRAITAHHAILIADVVAKEADTEAPEAPELESASLAMQHLWSDFLALQQEDSVRSKVEIFHDAKHALDDVHQQFMQGTATLAEQARAEQIYRGVCRRLVTALKPGHRGHQEIIDQLNEKLAEKLFVNFSVFQSVPDVWGIEQIFPITPIENLDKPLSRHAVIQDITCDSDGRIDAYVSTQGLESTLRLPETSGEKEILCFFLIGAYQEILGDMHNLFGDTDSVDVDIDASGNVTLEHAIRGDTTADVLNYVNLGTGYLLENYRKRLKKQGIEGEQYDALLLAFERGLASYTYLT